MAVADRGLGDDAGLGRVGGSVFFPASRAGSAVWVQNRGWRGGTGATHDLSAADRAKRERCGRACERSCRKLMMGSQPNRLTTRAELAVATPEGVLFRLPLAGPGPR